MRNEAEISAISHAEGINIDESFVSQRIKKYEAWIIKLPLVITGAKYQLLFNCYRVAVFTLHQL